MMHLSDFPRLIACGLLGCAALLSGCASVQRTDGTADAGSERVLRAHVTQTSTGRLIATDTSRTIDLTHPATDIWDRIRRGYAIPNLDTPLVEQWTQYYAARPESVQMMAQRAGKFLFHIVEEINRRGLPTELALLPFVESAYNPAAYSRAKAAGLWQFIPSTGKNFKLQQDWWRDERRDPIASTNAALDYLEYLFDFQGDWYLALASYNWGEGAVRRAMEKNVALDQPTDYQSLTMPDETRNYIPKLQAIKNIISDPERYAIALPEVQNEPYFVTIRKQRDIDIALAARFAEMPLDEFQALNPSYNRPVILGRHQPTLLLPIDRAPIFESNLAAHQGALTSWQTYQSKRNETLTSIARKFGITVAQLREINDLGRRENSARGRALLVPSQGQAQLASLEPVAVPAATSRTPSGSNVRYHQVRSGDTLFGLARQYGTTVENLRSLNNIKGNNLRIGARLRIPGTRIRG